MNKISKEEALEESVLDNVNMLHDFAKKWVDNPLQGMAVDDAKEIILAHLKAPTPTADETTFEVFNNKKDTWETVEYKENIFDDYIIDGIVKYECDNDWRIRLSKPKSPTADESDNKWIK